MVSSRYKVHRERCRLLTQYYKVNNRGLHYIMLDTFYLQDVNHLISHWSYLRKQGKFSLEEISNLQILSVYLNDLISQIKSY